jgi:hypothetical protein
MDEQGESDPNSLFKCCQGSLEAMSVPRVEICCGCDSVVLIAQMGDERTGVIKRVKLGSKDRMILWINLLELSLK